MLEQTEFVMQQQQFVLTVSDLLLVVDPERTQQIFKPSSYVYGTQLSQVFIR